MGEIQLVVEVQCYTQHFSNQLHKAGHLRHRNHHTGCQEHDCTWALCCRHFHTHTNHCVAMRRSCNHCILHCKSRSCNRTAWDPLASHGCCHQQNNQCKKTPGLRWVVGPQSLWTHTQSPGACPNQHRNLCALRILQCHHL